MASGFTFKNAPGWQDISIWAFANSRIQFTKTIFKRRFPRNITTSRFGGYLGGNPDFLYKFK